MKIRELFENAWESARLQALQDEVSKNLDWCPQCDGFVEETVRRVDEMSANIIFIIDRECSVNSKHSFPIFETINMFDPCIDEKMQALRHKYNKNNYFLVAR